MKFVGKDVDPMKLHMTFNVFPNFNCRIRQQEELKQFQNILIKNGSQKEFGMSLLNLDPDLEGEINRQTSSLRLFGKMDFGNGLKMESIIILNHI